MHIIKTTYYRQLHKTNKNTSFLFILSIHVCMNKIIIYCTVNDSGGAEADG